MREQLNNQVRYGRGVVTAIRGRHGEHRLHEVIGVRADDPTALPTRAGTDHDSDIAVAD
jgi:hypothetical protein